MDNLRSPFRGSAKKKMLEKTRLLLLLIHLLTAVRSALTLHADAGASNSSTEFIRTCCGATLYPDLCFTSLAVYAGAVQQDPVKLAMVASNVSLNRVRSVLAHVSSLSRTPADGKREAAALRDCVEVLGDAADQTRRSAAELGWLESAVGPEVGWRVSNAQTWMSAALTNEDTCADGLAGVGPGPVRSGVRGRILGVREYTSNALALVNHLVADRQTN